MNGVREKMTKDRRSSGQTVAGKKKVTDWDSMFSQSYDPDDDVLEDKLFNSLEKSFEEVDDEMHPAFSRGINDWEVNEETGRLLKTRDLLKQQYEEACAAADELGVDGTEKLSTSLLDFQRWCRSERKRRGVLGVEDENGGKSGSFVAMTDARCRGTKDRVFNTHSMRGGEREVCQKTGKR